MIKSTVLLLCPFCGSKATASVNKGESLWSHDVVDWTRVRCTNDDCNAQTEATREGYEPSAIEVWNRRTPSAAQGDAEDAARYRCIRRGQHWSVIDSIGNELRAEALDAAIDAARSQAKEGA